MPEMVAEAEWSYVPPGTVAGQDDVDDPGTNWALGEPMWGDIDVVRFYLRDTNPALRLISDLELQYLVDVWFHRYDSLVYVAAVAADNVSAKFAGVVTVTADGVRADVSDVFERYTALAAKLRQTHKDLQVGGEIDISNLLWDNMPDWSIDPLSFGVGMHDNREAGLQNYGGRGYGHGYEGLYEDTVRPGV